MSRTQNSAPRTRISSLRRAAGAASAFTMLEILVAVGAVALVTVGLAAIFDAVGKTVAGGRRNSVLTQYAAMIENQFRKDITSIDPNSFMVIRQQYSPASTPLYRGDAAPRARRIDEMVMFCRGDFASSRPPLTGERIAKGREARVYIGHLQRMQLDRSNANAVEDYLHPYVALRAPAPSLPTPELGAGTPNVSDVNLYAAEWILGRHVTVLAQPQVTLKDLPDLSALGVPNSRATATEDGDAQIALHPAAAEIFRAKDFVLPYAPSIADNLWAINPPGGEDGPKFVTGTVDVATTDLAEIRGTVLGMTVLPKEFWGTFNGTAQMDRTLRFTVPGRGLIPGLTALNAPSLYRMQAWMSEAFPAESIPEAQIPSYWGASPEQLAFDRCGSRVRAEDQPTDLRNVVEAATPAVNAYGVRSLQTAYERADQLMLTAHNFVPRCSEFIVEWSFGRTDALGQIIWHGPPANRGPEVTLYPAPNPTYNGDPESSPVLEEGFDYTFYRTDNVNNGLPRVQRRVHPYTDRLIYGQTPSGAGVVTSYFGYIDPTFDPSNPLQDDPSTPGLDETQGMRGVAGDTTLAPWPRPKLIRITMTLADPRDPKVEETFQFVFDVPQTRAR